MTQHVSHFALADTPDARVIAAMELEWPQWQVWVVVPAVSPKVWCARRWDDVDAVPAKVLNAGSSIELAEQIEDTVSGEKEDDRPADT